MPKRTNDGIFKRCEHSKKTWATCSCAWWMNYRGRKFSLDQIARNRGQQSPRDKQAARKLRDTLRDEIDRGEDPTAKPVVDPQAELTVGDVIDLYVVKYLGKGEKDGKT